MSLIPPAAEAPPSHRTLETYLPIAEHGIIGDLHSAALVGTDGTIDWYCPERFDAPAVFGAILDRRRGGFFRIAPTGREHEHKQLYLPETNVLITRFLAPGGVGEVHDFMVMNDGRQRLVRRVLGVRGTMQFRLELEPRFDYARARHAVSVSAPVIRFVSPAGQLSLVGALPGPALDGAMGVSLDFELAAGETRSFVLETGTGATPLSEAEAVALEHATAEFWRTWLAQSTYRGRWREMVHRSALTLKLMCYLPTGAMVAAPTTALPENVGGTRNWDYRFVWVRDFAFSIHALLRLGFRDEVQELTRFLASQAAESQRAPTATGQPLHVLYGIDPHSELIEEELDHLEGYQGSRPVRIGNGAANQLQLDIYGSLLDAAYITERSGSQRVLSYDTWTRIAGSLDWLCENWNEPDEGIWEVRSGRRRFTYSRLMTWVAFDRAIRIATDRGLPAPLARWTRQRDAIYQWIMQHGWNEDRGAFVQSDGSDALDASLLLMPLVHFIGPTDPRWLSTLDAIGRELTSDSLVYRYDPEVTPDGLEGQEATFSMCTFWYVECLARAGRLQEAQLTFEKMLTYANHLGLYSEQIGFSGELLGNFPQAFTHLGLISAALNLDRKLSGVR